MATDPCLVGCRPALREENSSLPQVRGADGPRACPRLEAYVGVLEWPSSGTKSVDRPTDKYIRDNYVGILEMFAGDVRFQNQIRGCPQPKCPEPK